MLKVDSIVIPGQKPFSLTVNKGECVGITGVSGCGKTRLLRAIADLDEHPGKVFLDGLCWRDVAAHEWRKKVAYLPAESQWWYDTIQPHFPANNVAFSELGFTSDVLSWQVSHCSSGEKQRLSMLRLLLNRPSVLLLDEPTANLDTDNSYKVEKLISDYVSNEQASVIWVSHNRTQLERVTDQCYVMSDGELKPLEH